MCHEICLLLHFAIQNLLHQVGWVIVNGGSMMGHLGQIPPLKKLRTRSTYSNRAVNYSNKAVTMFMR